MDAATAALADSARQPHRFGEVFDREHAVIWRYVARAAGRDVADDVVGDVFADAFARRDRFDPDRGTARTWLYGIATNRLRSRWRSERRARAAFRRAAHQQVGQHSPQAAVDDADELARQAPLVLEAIARLDADRRIVLLLAVWEGLSYEQIATALDLPIGTVRSRLSRARAEVRSALPSAVETRTTPEVT